MNKIPRQHTFDIVVAHARRQRVKAVRKDEESCDTGYCMYRTEGGLKCFAGALLPDEIYDSFMENWTPLQSHAALQTNWGESLITSALASQGHDLTLVRLLQGIHDCEPVDQWEKCFASLACRERLELSQPIPVAQPLPTQGEYCYA